jgi:NAD(P)-dependent dehydrogenase (short-subunit alcohol dehydrogenase family)
MKRPLERKITELFDLKGKVAIITGGHVWLGYDMACALAEAGCNIIITSRTSGKLDAALKEISSEYGVDILSLTMDHCDHDQVKSMAQQARDWKGHIDILINNAGGGSGASEGNLFKRSPKDMINLIHSNLIGALFCCQEVGRIMADQGFGKIINIGSVAGMVGRDRSMYRKNNKMEQPIDYAAAKAGVIGMTRDLAAFMAPYNVYVNSISPGGFDKGDLPAGFVKSYSDRTALGRMGRMGQDIKGAALFLASPASDYVTGHNLVVDGGFNIWK